MERTLHYSKICNKQQQQFQQNLNQMYSNKKERKLTQWKKLKIKCRAYYYFPSI
jgi:hypothetical protein